MNTTISLRLPEDLAKRLDAEVKRRRMADGSAASRADVVRQAIEGYLKKKKGGES
jgi:metal-responsive CopG/Arc/MetJ family transcriptional regulator